MSKKFLLDANAFIEPRDRYYAYDICPGYWSALLQLHNLNKIYSIDQIRKELMPSKKSEYDDIAKWIDNSVPDSFFKKTEDQKVIDKYQEMVTWVYSEDQYSDAAKGEFASVADGWLIAYAHANDHILVTHEEFNPEVQRRVPIPNVCKEFNVEHVNTFDMLRKLNVKFTRSTKRRNK